jgi:hypothetical protein
MSSVSKLVADRALVTRTVTSAAQTRAEEIAAVLSPQLFPDGAPRSVSLPDFILALTALLERTQRELEERDVALAQELGDDAVARDQRDARAQELRAVLVSARALIEGAYGAAALTRAGLGAAVPAQADGLVHYATAAAQQIEANDLGASSAVVTLDRAALAGRIRAGAAALREALDVHKREERETQVARARRDDVAERWLQLYPGIADTIAGLASAAGRTDIAERVRPTARRRAGRPEDVDLTPTDPMPSDPAPVDPPVDPAPTA